ncbi:hypothetical protein K432DRAFT_399810 [Lepidopterella palustris CBS 459.81]|uniref:BTB domain-containing protein n=1 Tax=Lepidopterella palustris CBS 459.81 TaxID=1314670 RepID=A0A8E2ELC6_9PEZI|nr:hypothetical protein K432DRAFT_399810 [Lepidopterella palustris CBS 459.81]
MAAPKTLRDTQFALKLGAFIITVLVGKISRKFAVQGDLIRTHSPLFEKTLSGNWKESEDGVVELLDGSIEIFEIYMGLLYTSTSTIIITNTGSHPPASALPTFHSTTSAYVFGDNIGDPDLWTP